MLALADERADGAAADEMRSVEPWESVSDEQWCLPLPSSNNGRAFLFQARTSPNAVLVRLFDNV